MKRPVANPYKRTFLTKTLLKKYKNSKSCYLFGYELQPENWMQFSKRLSGQCATGFVWNISGVIFRTIFLNFSRHGLHRYQQLLANLFKCVWPPDETKSCEYLLRFFHKCKSQVIEKSLSFLYCSLTAKFLSKRGSRRASFSEGGCALGHLIRDGSDVFKINSPHWYS